MLLNNCNTLDINTDLDDHTLIMFRLLWMVCRLVDEVGWWLTLHERRREAREAAEQFVLLFDHYFCDKTRSEGG